MFFLTFLTLHPLSMEEEINDEDLLTRIVFGALVNGLGYTQVSRFMAIQNAVCFSKNKFNEKISELSPLALDLAVRHCDEVLTESSDTLTVSFDGMWGTRRNSHFCIIDLFDIDAKKLIDFQIVSSYSFPFQHTNLTQGYKDSSKSMEAEGLSQLCERAAMKKASFYVHDSDLAAKEVIESHGLKCAERFDFNHVTKNVFKLAKVSGSVVNGLYKTLRGWFIKVLKDEEATDRNFLPLLP